jgi:hypothetical protein
VELTEMAKDFRQNEEVKSIILLAESANRKVKEESTLASTAAELTIRWCAKAAKTQHQYQIDEYQNYAQEAMTDAVDAARGARDALDQVKEAKRDMEELIFNLALAEQKARLHKQIDKMYGESAVIDAALKALDMNVTVIYADSTSEDKIEEIKAELKLVENILKAVESANKTGAIVEEKELLKKGRLAARGTAT